MASILHPEEEDSSISQNFTMVSLLDEEHQMQLLHQRNRVLAVLCGLEFDAEVELAAMCLQTHIRRFLDRLAQWRLECKRNRMRVALDALRQHARESIACATLTQLAFQTLADHALRERCAIVIQMHARGRRVRRYAAVRLLSRLHEERARAVDLELTVLFLQKHRHSRFGTSA